MAIKLLVESCSIRSIERLTHIRRDSIIDLLLIAGERCERLMDYMIQDVPVRDVQADEICSFIGRRKSARHSKTMTHWATLTVGLQSKGEPNLCSRS